MKIHPATQILALIAWIAWGAVGLEAFLIDLLELKSFATLAAAAATASVVAAMRYHGEKMAEATRDHACRVEDATQEHAALLTKHLLALDKVFGLGQRTAAASRRDAWEDHQINGHGSGEFKIYRDA